MRRVGKMGMASVQELALAVDQSGSVYAGGFFTGAGIYARNRIARISGDGVVDQTWNPSANRTVHALDLDNDGRLYTAGDFTEIGGLQRNYVAKLSTEGTGLADSQWNPSVTGITVESLRLDDSGHVYVGGYFTHIGGQPRNHVARLSVDGAGLADVDWDPSANSYVKAIELDNGGAVYIGGRFNSLGGQVRRGLGRLAADGTPGPARHVDVAAKVRAVARQADGGLIVGGRIDRVGDVPRSNLLRVQPDGQLDLQWNPSPDDAVLTIGMAPDGTVYIGGYFNNVGGLGRKCLAKLSGNGQGMVNPEWNPDPSGCIDTLAVAGDGAVYVGGVFGQIGGENRIDIAKLSDSGAGLADPTWDPVSNGQVLKLVVDSDNSVYAAGTFTVIGGQARNGFAKLSGIGTGVADSSWNPAPNSAVTSVVLDGAGSMYVGGNFTSIGGLPRQRLAKLSTHGAGLVDSLWNPGSGFGVLALAMGDDSVFASTAADSALRSVLLKISVAGSGLISTNWRVESDERVFSLLTHADRLYASGAFPLIGGSPRLSLAALPLKADRLFDNGFELAP